MTQYKIIQFYQINITPIEDLNDNGNMYFTTKLLVTWTISTNFSKKMKKLKMHHSQNEQKITE